MRQLSFALLLAVLLGSFPAKATEVDLELVLLADASRSIDAAEIRFQRQGYVEAIASPEVLDAITSGFLGRIAVTYVEWGSANSQDVVVPWTVVDGAASAAAFGDALLAAPRNAFGRNAIGNAIAIGQALIEGNDIEGFRKVIDLSADSASSFGGLPIPVAREAALAADIVINGLAVLCREADCSGRPVGYDLEAAFAERIIGGPGSFVVSVEGPDQFAEAVRRKLVLEIADLGGCLACRSMVGPMQDGAGDPGLVGQGPGLQQQATVRP